MRRVHLTASGLVQGVFFRASVRDEARRLGLTGLALNTPEGTVEVQVQGDDDEVEQFIGFCRSGPGHSRVDSLSIDDVDPKSNEQGFSVR